MKIIIISGAGISASAGIPTYRCAENSHWKVADLQKICTLGQEFSQESLDFYNTFRQRANKVEPTVVHKTFARWQREFSVKLYTQNIDDLLERGGAQKVGHLHGSMRELKCSECSQITTLAVEKELVESYCVSCQGRLRNNIVFYGEKGYYQQMQRDLFRLEEEDVLVVVGTSNEAIDIDSFIRPLRFHKILINPEINVDTCQYLIVLEKKIEDCLEDLQKIFEKGVDAY